MRLRKHRHPQTPLTPLHTQTQVKQQQLRPWTWQTSLAVVVMPLLNGIRALETIASACTKHATITSHNVT